MTADIAKNVNFQSQAWITKQKKKQKRNHPEKKILILFQLKAQQTKKNCLKKFLIFFGIKPTRTFKPQGWKNFLYLPPPNFLKSRDDYLSSHKIKKILTLQNDSWLSIEQKNAKRTF